MFDPKLERLDEVERQMERGKVSQMSDNPTRIDEFYSFVKYETGDTNGKYVAFEREDGKQGINLEITEVEADQRARQLSLDLGCPVTLYASGFKWNQGRGGVVRLGLYFQGRKWVSPPQYNPDMDEGE